MKREGIVFVFGAGASSAENAPIASELLHKTLTSPELENDGYVLELKEFLKEFFYVNIDDLENNPLPTFEEVLTIVDISLARQEDFSSRLNYETLWKISVLSRKWVTLSILEESVSEWSGIGINLGSG